MNDPLQLNTKGLRVHDAAMWDGKQVIAGRPPTWMGVARNKGPEKPNGLSRVRDTIHLFDEKGQLKAIVMPRCWIFYDRLSGELFMQTDEEKKELWTQLTDKSFVRNTDMMKFVEEKSTTGKVQ